MDGLVLLRIVSLAGPSPLLYMPDRFVAKTESDFLFPELVHRSLSFRMWADQQRILHQMSPNIIQFV